MAVVVRLRRMGTTNKPYFRIVAADERTANNGSFIERLGWYAPKQKGTNFEMDLDRIDYWKKTGARTTNTIDNLIKKARKQSATAETSTKEEEVSTKVKKVGDLPAEETADNAEEKSEEKEVAE